MIREDSRRFVVRSQRYLADGLSTQFEKAQSACADGILFVQTVVIPNSERLIVIVRDHAVSMYEDYLASAVNENVVPIYNQHIYPLYNQHIHPIYMEHLAPIVKTVRKEVLVIARKAQKEVKKARVEAALFITKSSSSVIKVIEEKNVDSILPDWVMMQLIHSSDDGEWAVDQLWKGFLILLVIQCRSFIYKIIRALFSVIWFFCPLRLFVGQRKDVKNGIKQTIAERK